MKVQINESVYKAIKNTNDKAVEVIEKEQYRETLYKSIGHDCIYSVVDNFLIYSQTYFIYDSNY